MKKWKSQIFIYLNLLIRVPGIRGISTLMIGNHHKYYTTRETSCGVAHQLHHSTNNAFMSSFSSSLHSLLIIWRASVNFISRKSGKGYSAKKTTSHLIPFLLQWTEQSFHETNEPRRCSGGWSQWKIALPPSSASALVPTERRPLYDTLRSAIIIIIITFLIIINL